MLGEKIINVISHYLNSLLVAKILFREEKEIQNFMRLHFQAENKSSQEISELPQSQIDTCIISTY